MDKIVNILSPQYLLIIVFLSVIGDKSNIPLKQVRYQPGIVELVLRSAVLGCFVLPSRPQLQPQLWLSLFSRIL